MKKPTAQIGQGRSNKPGLSIFAFPIGIRKSGDKASSDISNAVPYNISFSSTITATNTVQ